MVMVMIMTMMIPAGIEVCCGAMGFNYKIRCLCELKWYYCHPYPAACTASVDMMRCDGEGTQSHAFPTRAWTPIHQQKRAFGCKLLLNQSGCARVISPSTSIHLFQYIVSWPDKERRHHRNSTSLNSHVAINILTRCGHLGATRYPVHLRDGLLFISQHSPDTDARFAGANIESSNNSCQAWPCGGCSPRQTRCH